MAGDRCVACRKASDDGARTSEFAVARTSSGSGYLAEYQCHCGAVEFTANDCVRDLHDLGSARRSQHLDEMALVAASVTGAFRPVKLSAAQGNRVPHLHWHVVARHADDPRPVGPIWEDPEFLVALRGRTARPTSDELFDRRAALLDAFDRLGVLIERRDHDQ
jgi:diadenosine tetraphosphate (Ap4A) HIT family hydrolase